MEAYYLKDGKVRNHYDDIELENKKKNREVFKNWRTELLNTSTYRKIINDKIREYTEELIDEEDYLDGVFRKRTTLGNNKESIFWNDWQIERSKMRWENIKKIIYRWQMKKKVSLGQIEDKSLNIDGAKETLICELMDSPPVIKSNGREFYKCPLHDEVKGSSFCWFKKDNKWWCFSCNIGGDSIDLYQKLHNASFKEAILTLNQ